MTTGPTPRLERVVLLEEEAVVRGRTRTVVFRVRVNDGWMRASRHETARREQLSRGPGIVFRTRIELSLPPGAVVERTDTEQLPDAGSALDHLVSGRRGPRTRVTRTRLTVEQGGELRPEPRTTK